MVAAGRQSGVGQHVSGTQGDEWDAQKDMAAAFAGAVLTMMVTAGSEQIERSTPA